MKKGLLIILAAPSGTGKSTICKELIKNNKNWNFSVSVTTRNPRDGEIDGKDYQFISNSEFEHFVKFGDFIEWEIVHGNKYGTLWSTVDDALDNKKVMILDIDVKGAMSIYEEHPDETILIFIEPPGLNIVEQKEILNERLVKRGNEQELAIKHRLKRFETEMEFKEKFSHHFVNENLKKTIDKVEKLIKGNIK
ncbi:MAG: guanylate kinase [Candidatus Marinimicrobia bacterium]|nr:guanylate kinase [Candidatus Neomarinimicrobiota bacterium]|tara:strand:+ start:261 stop:842 length:582 start_codon:yes stop_codon:yes gene_type:complete